MKLSIVVPVYNSELCLGELVEKMNAALKQLENSCEIVLVNDGSTDRSWQRIEEIAKRDGRVRGINFRKNFGQNNALMAGLVHSCGEKVVIMDDDLQHDPADIPLLLNKLDDGYDVCYANFIEKKQSAFKNFGSWFNGKIAEIVIDKPKGIYLSPFKAIKGEVVREIIKYDGPYPYVDGLIFGITQRITQVDVAHHKRYAGRGNYGLIRSLNVWSHLATSFSLIPLRISIFFGFIIAGISFLTAIGFLIERIFGAKDPAGWASMILSVLFLGGIQLIMMGIIGEYIGRLALYHNKKPQFVIDRVIGRLGRQ